MLCVPHKKKLRSDNLNGNKSKNKIEYFYTLCKAKYEKEIFKNFEI